MKPIVCLVATLLACCSFGAGSADIQAMIDAATVPTTIALDPAVNYTITTPIAINRSGVTIDGRGAVISKDFHGFNQSDPTVSPAFCVGCGSSRIVGTIVRNLTFKNIGAPAGGSTDPGYYTQLNGIAVAYNRRYNKHINNDAAITVANATDVLVENCRAEEVGRFIATSGVNAGKIVVRNSHVAGWGHVAVSVGSESLITGNIFDNSAAPIYNTSDRDNDLGTSHAVYVYNGHDSVMVANNTFMHVRNNAIKFDTSGTGAAFDRILIEGNLLDSCTWTVYVGRVAGQRHEIQVVGNHFKDSGYASINGPDARVSWQANTHHGSGTARSDAGTAQVIGFEYAALNILANTFDAPGPCSNCGGSSAENSAVSLYSSATSSSAMIQGNIFSAEYTRSLYVTETHAGQTMRASSNQFFSPVYVRYVGDGARLSFSHNIFDTTLTAGSVVALYSEYRNVLVDHNTFIVADNDIGIIPDDQGTTGWFAIISNTFFGAEYGTGINGVVTGPATLYVQDNTYLRVTDANMEGKIR